MISDDELDRQMTEAAKDFPFYGEQMLKFLHKERDIKRVSRKLISDFRPQTSDPGTSGPSNFVFKLFTLQTRLNSYHLMFCGHAMFKGNSQKKSKYLSSPVKT